MTTKTIVLITGANAGLGYELASQLLADSTKHVLLGSRSVEKGEAAIKKLQEKNLPGSVELVGLDVTNEATITAASDMVEKKHGRLDILVNNAAIATPSPPLSQSMAQAFATNATGPLLMAQAFLPLLKKSLSISRTPRIINISSGMGSITNRLHPAPNSPVKSFYEYRASKAALNMITACLAVEYGDLGIKAFAFCPGFTVSGLSELNTAANGAKPTAEGVRPLLGIIDGKRDAESGGFFREEGTWPW